MPITRVPAVTLTPVAYFPEKYFLENLAVRSDGSVLITAVLQKELWCGPGPEPRAGVSPVLVHTFDQLVSGIVEVEPDVFIISLSDAYTSHESHLARVDLNDWTPGDPEFVAAIDNTDDFCLDDNAGFAYVTRHRANTIDRVPLEPRHASEVRHLAGDPFDEVLVGPSSRTTTARRLINAGHCTSDLTHEREPMNRHSEMIIGGWPPSAV